MSTNPPIDLGVIETLRTLQPEDASDIIGELLDMFLKTSPPLLEKMHQAIEQNDSEALYKAAHALKGNSGALGAVELAECARHAEIMGRMKNMQDAPSQVVLVEQAYARAIEELEKLRGK